MNLGKSLENIIGKNENKLLNYHRKCRVFFNNTIITRVKQIANDFNNYFVNISKGLAQQLTNNANHIS